MNALLPKDSAASELPDRDDKRWRHIRTELRVASFILAMSLVPGPTNAVQGFKVNKFYGLQGCCATSYAAPDLAACNGALDEWKAFAVPGSTNDWTRCMIPTQHPASTRADACAWGEFLPATHERFPYCPAQFFATSPYSYYSVRCDGAGANQWTSYTGNLALDCPSEPKRKQPPPRCGTREGNPCNPATGQKWQIETDLDLPWVTFTRTYDSAGRPDGREPVGRLWRHGFQREVRYTSGTRLVVYRETGQEFIFTLVDGVWKPDDDVPLRVSGTASEWRIDTEDGAIELYDASGFIKNLRARGAGFPLTFEYDPTSALLTDIVSPYGNRRLVVHWTDDRRIDRITDESGAHVYVDYAYDGVNLLSATYPGAAGESVTRTYGYAPGTSLLTDIEDENGDAYASWQYADGKVTQSRHGQDAEVHTFQYAGDQTTVTTPKGGSRTYTFEDYFGVRKPVAITGTRCLTCGGEQYAALSYDENGYRNIVTDFAGNQTDYDYDDHGLESQRIEGISAATPQGVRRIETDWDTDLRQPTRIDVHAGPGTTPVTSTIFTYANDRLATRTESDGIGGGAERLTTYAWYGDGDPAVLTGLLKTVDGPSTAVTTYQYRDSDSASWRTGDLWKRVNGLGHVTEFLQYDAHGRPLQIKDANDVVTTLTWHPRGWLRTVTTGGRTTTLEYDAVGQVTKITTGAGDFLAWQYDSAHRLTRITDSTGDYIAITPDAFGNAGTLAYTEAGGAIVRRTVQQVYNALNRLEKTVGGAGQTTWTTYDANGDPACTFDPRHAAAGGATVPTCPPGAPGYMVTKQVRDALNRVVTEHAAAGGVTTTGYDALDRVTAVDPPGAVAATSFPGNGFGEATQEVSPDRGTRGYTYDTAGNLETVTDGRGVVATHAYDAANRLTGTTFSGATPAIVWKWDTPLPGWTCNNGAGHLCGISDESGTTTTTYDYDARGNVTTKTVAVTGPGTFTAGGTFETDYTYDGADRLTTLTYPSDRQVRYERDAAGRITGVYTRPASGAEVAVVTGVQYAPFGPIEAMSFGTEPNAIATSVTLDADYRVTAIDHGGASLGNLRDAADNLTQETDLQPLGRGYDTLSRLTMADDYYMPSATEGYYYSYDANGNRTGKVRYTTDTWFNSLYTFDPLTSNRLKLIVPGGQPWEPSIDPEQVRTYDAAGNVTGIDYNGASSYLADIALSYGGHGRPTTVTTGAPASPLLTVAIGHNGLGQRVRMDVTGGSLQGNFPDKTLHYDEAGHIIAEYRATGEAYEYLYLDDLPVGFVHYPDAQSSGTVYYYHTDHLGTPRWATNAAGAVVWTAYQVDPFRLNGSGPVNPGLRFAGQYYQPETGFYYNYFRDYDPQTGRYLQPDPIGLAGGLNPYTYVNSNPLRFTDPQGLFLRGPASWAAAIAEPATTTAGVAASTIVAAAAGVAAVLYPAPVGEGSDFDGCPPDDPRCKEWRRMLDANYKRLSGLTRASFGADWGQAIRERKQFNDLVDLFNMVCKPPYNKKFPIGPQSPAIPGQPLLDDFYRR